MGKNDWTFWTHGVNVAVESPELVTLIKRWGKGTLIRQPCPAKQTSFNWFHFAIPTPNQLDGQEDVRILSAFVRARLNENASITAVDIWAGNRKIQTAPKHELVYNPDKHFHISVGGKGLTDVEGNKAGINICVRVDFLTGDKEGEVTFEGAGATFERQ